MALQSERLYKGMGADMRNILMVLTTTVLLVLSAVTPADADSITPLAVTGCTDGSYVSNPGSNAGLVSDCKALVSIRNHWTDNSDNAGLPDTAFPADMGEREQQGWFMGWGIGQRSAGDRTGS